MFSIFAADTLENKNSPKADSNSFFI